MATQYEDEILEPELKPQYINKTKKIMKQNKINVGNINNLRKKLKL